MTVEEKVKQIVIEQLAVAEQKVTPTASLVEDLGADSLDMVSLLMSFEEAFGIEVPDQDAANIRTVQAAVDYVRSMSAAHHELPVTIPLQVAGRFWVENGVCTGTLEGLDIKVQAEDFSQAKLRIRDAVNQSLRSTLGQALVKG